MKRCFLLLCLFIFSLFVSVFSQSKNVGIGTLSPDSSAILELKDSSKGFLIPRINLVDVNLPTPVNNPAISLLVYNINPSITGGSGTGFYYWNGTKWIQALGPQGATGPQGPQGLQGQIGVTGTQGSQGIPGMTGPQGSQGLQGSTGLQGTQGPQGLQGNAGTNGVTGPTGVDGATGTQGPQGLQGLPGADGTTGPQGLQGAQGPSGTDGATGPQGPQGLQGATGAEGPTGPQGPQGLQGPSGADGATGPQGSQGLQGLPGADGTTGSQGPQGFIGTTGPTGLQGATGAQGPTGSAGTNGTNGTNGVTGPTGANGLNGVTGSTGLQGPTGAAGNNGTTGPTGLQGATGAQGPTGSAGTNGTNGVTGPTGTPGATGVQGITGPTGSQGIAGVTGATGRTGATGPTGAQGVTGAQGPTGSAGTNGTNGVTGPTGTQGSTGVQGITGPTGSQGIAGVTGATGRTGATGTTGTQGPTGNAGTNGTNGVTGPTGIQGVTGNAGANGTTGPTGPQGSTGTAGATGALGITGPTGPGSVNGTATRVAFFSGAVGSASTSLISTSSSATDLFWDNTNYRLGIRTSTPSMALDVFSGSTTGSDAAIRGSSTGTGAVLYGVLGTAASATTNTAGVFGNATGNGMVFGVLGITTATTANASGVRGYAGGASGATNGVWGENASATAGSSGVYGFSSATTNGTNWALPISGVYGKAANSTSQYQAGIYGYQSGTGNNSGGVVGAYSSGTWGGLGYSDASGNRWGVFSPANTKIEGYLLVGNPIPPTSSGGQYATLYSFSFDAGSSGWSQNVDCDGAGDGATHTWSFSFTTNNGVMTYDNLAHRNRSNLYSPKIWIPAGTTSIGEEGHFSCTLEDNFDGVFLEYSVNGGLWTKVTVFTFGGYPDNANGSNTACSGNNAQACWNGTVNGPFRCSVGSAGSWIQFRFVGMEDAFTGTGKFDLYGFSVYGVLPATVGGPFAVGNIYAENNVYAGSNALVGDVAEYFHLDVSSEPGDLIAMRKESGNNYTVSNSSCSPYVIGVHSTNPTVTLNKPEGVPVSLTGRVPIKITDENGAIKIGDFLTSSSKRGVAMKARKSCFIIGRALENSSPGKNTVLCMVETGWYNPSAEGNSISEGSFFVQESKKEITVYDNSIVSESRVFLTFRNKTGTEYWISKVAEGYFTVEFDQPLVNEVSFDYLVTNSRNTENKKTVMEMENGNGNFSPDQAISSIKLLEFTTTVPPNPPNPENVYTWSSETGLITLIDVSAKRKKIEGSLEKEHQRIKLESEEKLKGKDK